MAAAKFEDVKKEIRSLLISYQKGTSLSEFRKEYRSMIGRNLPFQDFGYKDEHSFLKAMPDAVRVFPSPVPGDYHLFGVADESIKHIQKMVVKQKASKHKTRYRAPNKVSNAYSSAPSYASNYGSTRASNKSYELPPRFAKKELPQGLDRYIIQMLNNYPNGIKLSEFMDLFCVHYKRQFNFREWGFSTLEECLETVPGINARNKNNNIIIHLVASNSQLSHHAAVKQDPVSKDQPSKNSHPINNQPSKNQSLASHAESSTLNKAALDFFDRDFKKHDTSNQPTRNHSQSSHLGSSTLSPMTPDFFDCDINKNENKSSTNAYSDNFLINRMIQDSYAQKALKEKENRFEKPLQPEGLKSPAESANTPTSSSHKIHDHDNHMTFASTADLLDDFSLDNFKDNPTNRLLDDKYPFSFDSPLVKGGSPPVSGIVRNNLIKMIGNYPQGIFAVHFSSCYEKCTGMPFDLHSLGFNNLSELIDAVPDILIRKPLKGSKKDWVIYSAESTINEATVESGSAEVSVLFVQCIILNIRKILQANPEGIPISNFIHHYCINCTEPLYVRDLGFDNLENFLLSIASRVPLEITFSGGEKVVSLSSFQETIRPPVCPLQKPADVASLDSKFKPYELPSDFDFSKFCPVYTSSIANPGLLYIQFVGEETSEALKILYDEIDTFYNGDSSDLYRMKPVDIKPNTLCIALWPSDKQWYRAHITAIVSLDFVQVFYDDYGTTDEIPMNMLRYIKKDFMALPTQAVKSRLAYLKPTASPGQSTHLWDKRTRKKMLDLCQDRPLMAKIENIKDGVLAVILCDTSREDMDLYINDVLIEEKLAEVCGESDEPQQQVHPSTPDPNMQQLIELMKLMTSNPALANQLQSLSSNVSAVQTPFIFPPQQSLPPMSQQFPNISPLISPKLNASIPSFGDSLTPAIPPPKYPPGLNIPGAAGNVPKTTNISELSSIDTSPPLTPSPDDDELFDDDDDEYFEQLLCQKNISAKKRHVKRVKTTDGYVFHVLLFDSQPYISSGDISVLIWHAKTPSYLFHKLQAQEIELASVTLMENGNEEFFAQLERFKVKGVEKMGSEASILLYPLSKFKVKGVEKMWSEASILLYPLSKGNQILNLFGHPSATLRAKINTELVTFSPSSSHWQELPDSEIPEELEDVRIVTDDDKMNRLCLYDLKTMREGIRCKRLKLVKRREVEGINPELDEEINKLNQLSNKVRERIVEIEQIISMFSVQRKT